MAATRKRERELMAVGAAGSVKLVARSTRGKRMESLVGEEAEADEEFWGQEAWEVVSSDSEFSSDKSDKDEFDSDFNDTESEEDEENEGIEAEGETRRTERAEKHRSAAAKSGAYREVVVKRKVVKKGGGGKGGVASEKSKPIEKEKKPVEKCSSTTNAYSSVPDRNVRASTKNKTKESTRLREEEEKEARMNRKKYQPVPKKKFRQEELLEDATKTELRNIAWLAEQKRLAEVKEQENKSAARPKKPLAWSYHSSRGGIHVLTFPDCAHFPAVLEQGRPEPRDRPICVITGLLAKYCDPYSGLPYATLDAYKEIRQQYGKKPPARLKDMCDVAIKGEYVEDVGAGWG